MEKPIRIKRRNVSGPACRYYQRSLCQKLRPVIVAYGYGLMFHHIKIINAQKYDSMCARIWPVKVKRC